MKKQSGFTLVEMVTVVAILSILAAVAVPTYLKQLPDRHLKSAARNLKSDILLAQQRAIRENGSVAVVFDVAGGDYQVFVDNGAGGGTANDWTRNGTEALVRSETLPKYVGMDSAAFGGNPRVRLDGRGLPDQLGVVQFSNTDHHLRRVTLSIAGRARIQVSTDGGGSWHDDD